MFLHIVLTIAIAIIALSIVFHFTPWSKANRFKRLLTLAEQGNDRAFRLITDRDGSWRAWVDWPWREKFDQRTKVLKVAIDQLRASANQRERIRQAAEELAKRQAELRANVERWRERLRLLSSGDETTEERLTKKIDILQRWSQAQDNARAVITSDLFDPDHLLAEISREFTGLCELLEDQAREGSIEAFRRLKKLLETFTKRNGPLQSVGIDRKQWPNDWDQLVARYVDRPYAGDFLRNPEWEVGQISLEAQEALRTQNITTAKIVMASCNALPARRTEIGDVLWADLVKFVDAENVRLRADRLRSEREQADQVG